MAGAACKVIIDSMREAIARSLHQVVDGETGRTRLSAEQCDSYYQRLADIDNICYTGGAIPHGGLRGIAKELTKLGVFDKDVWVMLNPGG